MIDAERMPTTTYRVEVDVLPRKPTPYYVITYPESVNGQPPITNGHYAWEALPAWMQSAIQMLDVAGRGVYISGVGELRLSGIYWLWRTDNTNPANPGANLPVADKFLHHFGY